MHALVGIFKMDASKRAEQQQTLEARIIPSVKQAPGFVSGYWNLDHATSKSYSYIVMETEEAARKLAGFVKGNVAAQSTSGVALESLSVVELVGEAHGA